MTVGLMNNKQKKTQVEEELANLGLSLSALEEIVSRLRDRLSPVLRTEAEGKGSTEAIKESHQLVPLADSIREHRYLARTLEEQLEEIIEIIEL